MIKLKDLILEDYDSQMRRKYRGNYTDVQVQDIHFQTDSDEFEDMMDALGARFGAITPRENQEDAEIEVKSRIEKFIEENKEFFNDLGAKAIQGKAYLPGKDEKN